MKNYLWVVVCCLISLAIVIVKMTACSSDKGRVDTTIEQVVIDLSTEFEPEIYDPYKLSEAFFTDSTLLEMKVRIIYYANGSDSFSTEAARKRLEIASQVFEDSKARISFTLDTVVQVFGRPIDNPEAKQAIDGVLALTRSNSDRRDLKDYYLLDQMNFWSRVYGKPGYMNIHVVNDTLTPTVAYAAGIGAIDVMVRIDAMAPNQFTLEHELGHALGLYHTHEIDNSEDGLNDETGDRVRDTPKGPPLVAYQAPGTCEMRPNWQDLHNQVRSRSPRPINDLGLLGTDDNAVRVITRNIMTYTNRWCRQDFTEVQVRRMRKQIEGSADLRQAIVGMDNVIQVSEFLEVPELQFDSLLLQKQIIENLKKLRDETSN